MVVINSQILSKWKCRPPLFEVLLIIWHKSANPTFHVPYRWSYCPYLSAKVCKRATHVHTINSSHPNTPPATFLPSSHLLPRGTLTLNVTARAANYRLLALNLHTFFPLHNVSWKSHFFKNWFNSTTAERTIYVIRQHSITSEFFSMTAGPYSFTRFQARFPSTADSAS